MDILKVQNVSKTFPGVKALDNASFKINQGEIHALMGENGAGKSTLMKILNGNYKKDSGTIWFDGKEVEITSPQDARNLGISIIFQELNLISSLSVAENIYLGRLPKNNIGLVNWNLVYENSKRILNKIGYNLDPRTLVSELSIAQMQMVEIAKALSFENTKLILMDEPSATLTNKECETLFSVIKELKSQGVSVIYISHKLEEVFEICEWVTVLRDGQIIDSLPIRNLTKDEIVTKMIGREIVNKFPKRSQKPKENEILRVENLSRKGILKNINFSLYKGEVVGLAGLVGAGRTEMARALFGVDYRESGNIYIDGEKVNIKNPVDAIKKGLVYLSEDRKSEGLILNSTVKWNISIANIKSILKNGLITDSIEKQIVNESIKALNIKTPHMNQLVVNLSGGNQQKIVVGKWLNTEAKIFIFDEPTRGIDVGAKYEIYLLINKLISEGRSVIIISSDMPEVLEMSDRILVFKEGKITAELTGQNKTARMVIDNAL
jgi:ribose transport system ATP-binding protein